MHDIMMDAVQGDAEAAFRVGYAFEKGEGVAQNEKEAVRWYTIGANHGGMQCQYNLALMFEEGRGCSVDLRRAFHTKIFLKLPKHPTF